MGKDRKERMVSEICHHSADFFHKNSNRQSLITVTRCDIASNLKTATVFISVLPADHEIEALRFAQRQAGQIRNYITDHVKMGRVPYIDVMIDGGEKNRQKIDEIINKVR